MASNSSFTSGNATRLCRPLRTITCPRLDEEDVIEIAAETGAYHVSTMCCTYRGRGGLEREWLIDSLGWGDGGDERKIIFGRRHHLAAHAVVRGGDEVCVAVGGRGSGGGIALCGGVHASTETNECSRLLWRRTRASDRYRSSLPVLVSSIREIKVRAERGEAWASLLAEAAAKWCPRRIRESARTGHSL